MNPGDPLPLSGLIRDMARRNSWRSLDFGVSIDFGHIFMHI